MGDDRTREKTEEKETPLGQTSEKLRDEVYDGGGDGKLNGHLERAKEEMSLRQNTQKVLDQFPRFDSDQDGFLTKQELDSALQNEEDEGTRNGLKALSDSYDSAMTRSNDEWFFESSGLSLKDLESDAAIRQEMIERSLGKAVEEYPLFKMDTDGDGQLSRAEVTSGLDKSEGDERLMIDYINRHYDDIKSATSLIVWDDPGITGPDWTIYHHPYAESDPFGPS